MGINFITINLGASGKRTFGVKVIPFTVHLEPLAGNHIAETLSNTIGCENIKKVYQMLLAGTADTEAVKGYNREIYSLFHSVLEKGILGGEFKSSLSKETLSRHFVMAIRGISYEWCIRYPNFNLKEQVVSHCRLLIEGIAKNTCD